MVRSAVAIYRLLLSLALLGGFCLLFGPGRSVSADESKSGKKPPVISADSVPGESGVKDSSILRKWIDEGRLDDFEEIVFCLRVHGKDHWYGNFAYYSAEMKVPLSKYIKKEDGMIWAYGDGAALCKLNLRTGKLTVLLHDQRGGIRDPHVHYDGQKILFSYRPGGTHNYHLYEIDTDGQNMRQLTDGPDDDFEAVYLPCDDIMFVSSRQHRFVNCFYTRVTNLYRMKGDGSDIRPLSSNVEHDNTPWVLPDGRILYMRWEYVDRSQLDYHHLWTMAPDGTGQMVYYGNQTPGFAMLDAKPIPGTRKIVASFNPGHGRPEHMGYVTIVDPSLGPDDPQGAVSLAKPDVFRDPYPLAEDAFFVVGVPGIAVMNGSGDVQYIYRLMGRNGEISCHEPRPIRSRPREPIIPEKIDRRASTGRFFLFDVYHGRNMEGVRRGDIKKLLVLEQLPKPVNFSGGMEPLTIRGTFTLPRILGTVPVAEDGSAYFEAPALRSIFFVALDENNLSVKRMQSFTTLQPGETLGCVGCHETRVETPIIRTASPNFLGRTPDPITPVTAIADVPDFPRDIQPILDRHCVECHRPERREGGIELTGDHTPMYSVSYWAMFRHKLVVDGGNLPESNYAPRTIGSSASPLVKYIEPSHHDVRMTEEEKNAIKLWIDASAVYPGTYAALGTGMVHFSSYFPGINQRCGECHGTTVWNKKLKKNVPAWRFGATTDNAGKATAARSLVNLDRPEMSIFLRAPLAKSAGGLELCGKAIYADRNDPLYRAAIQRIEQASDQLKEVKRFDMPGFRPREEYIREMKRFGILPKDLGPDDPIDIYDTDQRYWESFWVRGAGE